MLVLFPGTDLKISKGELHKLKNVCTLDQFPGRDLEILKGEFTSQKMSDQKLTNK